MAFAHRASRRYKSYETPGGDVRLNLLHYRAHGSQRPLYEGFRPPDAACASRAISRLDEPGPGWGACGACVGLTFGAGWVVRVWHVASKRPQDSASSGGAPDGPLLQPAGFAAEKSSRSLAPTAMSRSNAGLTVSPKSTNGSTAITPWSESAGGSTALERTPSTISALPDRW
jgi:hypothetical protein